MFPTPELVQSYIAAGLDCAYLSVEGDGQHFQAIIVCAAFEGKMRIARHQMVYAVLGERMREEIHALSMKTLTPSEYATLKEKEQAGPVAGEPRPLSRNGSASIPVSIPVRSTN